MHAGALMAGIGVAAAAAVVISSATSDGVDARTGTPRVLPDVRAASELSIRQLAGQRIVCGFDGRTAPTSLLGAISYGELAGVILFDKNIGTRNQVARLTSAIQATNRPR